MRKTVATLGLLCLTAVGVYGLDVGDKAPPVKVKKWVVGKGITPDKPDGKTVYVVEFWATWCGPCLQTIPHLNELHQRLKRKGVAIAGITAEGERKVAAFARKHKMQYNVGVDDNRATHALYMKGVPGIPHAFVVGRDGKIAWHGHPMGGMDRIINSLVSGAYDAGAAKDVNRHEKALQRALRASNIPLALSSAKHLVKLEPANYDRLAMLVRLLAHKKDTAGILKARREAATRFATSAESLHRLARDIVADRDLALRDLPLALECATKSVALDNRRNNAGLDTLARVYHELCLLDQAIALQKEALAVASSGSERREAARTLEYYETVRTLADRNRN